MEQAENQERNQPVLVTFALFAYKQEAFIAEAVRGALSQDYSPLEIILSDDCSPDGTFAIMQDIAAAYQGPHTIVLNRTEKNLGLIGHINQVMAMAKGELIVVGAGDDISLPVRVTKVVDRYRKSNNQAYSIFSNAWVIDEAGQNTGEIVPNTPKDLSLDYFGRALRWAVGYSQAYHKDVFRLFPPINPMALSEDIVLPLRAAILGQVVFINEPLLLRRYHDSNMSRYQHLQGIPTKIRWHKRRARSVIENNIGITETRLRDLEVAAAVRPDIKEKIVIYQSIAKQHRKFAEYEYRYLDKSLSAKLVISYNAIFDHIPISQLIRWMMKFITPDLYYLLIVLKRIVK